MTEQEQRAAVVDEAMTWIRTPFIHNAKIKGVGADCETFLAAVYAAVGVFDATNSPYVPSQWYQSQSARELYIARLSDYATEYDGDNPQPGDVIVVKSRWVYSHGAIVVEWPRVVHAFPPCVMESNATTNPVFRGHDLKFYNPFVAVQP